MYLVAYLFSSDRCAIKHDVITVRDGTTRDAAVLATFCGSVRSTLPVIHSSRDSALLEFVSDQADQRQGFSATFQFVAAASLGVVTQPSPVAVSSGVVAQYSSPVKPSASSFGN